MHAQDAWRAPGGPPGWVRSVRSFPWVPVLVVLGVLSALTHLPLILLGLLGWFLLSRARGSSCHAQSRSPHRGWGH